LLDRPLDVVVAPLEIGGKEQALRIGIDAAGHADAYAFEGTITVRCAHGLHALHDLGNGACRLGDERHGFACEEASVEIDERDDGLMGSDVCNQNDHGVVERKKSRGAATGTARHGAFGDPLFFDQLLNDGGDCAGLQPGRAGKIGTSYRLLRSDNLEDDVAVDVTRVFTGRKFDISQVDALDSTSSVLRVRV
jgi:hypothetical protein